MCFISHKRHSILPRVIRSYTIAEISLCSEMVRMPDSQTVFWGLKPILCNVCLFGFFIFIIYFCIFVSCFLILNFVYTF